MSVTEGGQNRLMLWPYKLRLLHIVSVHRKETASLQGKMPAALYVKLARRRMTWVSECCSLL